MESIVSLILIIFIVYFVFKILRNTFVGRAIFQEKQIELPKPTKEYLPYYKKGFFLTKAEYNFFRILERIIKDEYYIFPQVNLASIVNVNVGRWETYKYRNPINRKILDYVIFDKQYLSPLLVIELDDATHQLLGRRERDDLVDKVLEASGIKIVHIKTAFSYDFEKLSKYILDNLPHPIAAQQQIQTVEVK